MRVPLLLLVVPLALACSAEPQPLAMSPQARSREWRLLEQQIRDAFPDVPITTVDELASRMERGDPAPLLLDARAEEEFAVSHLDGARRAQTLDEALALLPGESRAREIVVYCSVGYRSAHLARDLQQAGYTNVANLEGSIFAWANAGRPVYRGGEPVREVHPYDEEWGRFLERSRWSKLPGE